MVLHRIKSLFVRNTSAPQLVYSGKSTPITTTHFDRDTLLLNDLHFKYAHIQDLQLKDDKISFQYKNEEYQIIGMSKLHDKIVDHLSDSKKMEISYYVLKDKEFVKWSDDSVFVEIADGRIRVSSISENNGTSSDTASDSSTENDNLLHLELIRPTIQFYFTPPSTFVWLAQDNNTYMIRFKSNIDYLQFMSEMNSVLRGYHADGECVIDDTVGINYESDNNDILIDDDIVDSINNTQSITIDNKDYNKLLTNDSNNCFVSRGSSIGIFTCDSDTLNYNHTIKNIDSLVNTNKLVKNDNKLLLHEMEKLRIVDLGKEKVNDIKLKSNDIMKKDQELVGVRDKEIFGIDLRVKDGKGKEYKKYKSNTEMVLLENNKKNTVTVSKKGDIRIYDELGKNAKILIGGLGDYPISVSMNNKSMVLITYSSYLILSIIQYKKAERKNYRLGLKPEDITHLDLIGKEFKNAKFNKNGTIIISIIDRFIISWNVEDILDGILFSYKVRKYSDVVVDDCVIDDKRIIVSLRDDIKMMRGKY